MLCGFDEAGRGPLAGPVVAGAVVLPEGFPVEILGDSKKLSEKRRVLAAERITKDAFWGIGIVGHEDIDRLNILQASLLAMRLAFEDMAARFPERFSVADLTDLVGIADGTFCPDVPFACRAEPKADSKHPSVMAASIIAKVRRDSIMAEFDRIYPEYGYARHKGYPTAAHREVCRRLGPSPIQRLTFRY